MLFLLRSPAAAGHGSHFQHQHVLQKCKAAGGLCTGTGSAVAAMRSAPRGRPWVRVYTDRQVELLPIFL